MDIDYKKISSGLKMPKQYNRNIDDLYYKSFYNQKRKDNISKYIDEVVKGNDDDITFINNNENKNNEKERVALINNGNLINEQSLKIENKDKSHLKDCNSFKEKGLFIRKSSNALKKVDNIGLKYHKIDSKNNIAIKLNISNGNKHSSDLNYKNEPKSLLASLRNHGLEHKRLIKNSLNERLKNPYSIVDSKQVSKQMLRSDIFFQKDLSFKENYKINNNFEKFNSNLSKASVNNKSLNQTAFNKNLFDTNKYHDSDIFSVKNNETSLNKIGEKYLLRDNSGVIFKNSYNITSRSNSDWVPENKIISLINHESTNYDFINPLVKNKLCKKDDVITQSNPFNPNNIQKCIGEIIDLTRNGSPNPNKEYLKAYKNDNTVFRKRGQIAESFGNLHHEYKGICDKPYVKKLI